MNNCTESPALLALSLRTISRHLPLLLLFVVFFVLEFVYPRFPNLDSEISRKAAGLHLVQGGAFAAPELEGFLHVDPPVERIYFVYPPLYTWLFGQWTRMTGFGWAACVGYDALISGVLAFIIYGVAGVVADALLGPISVLRRIVLGFVPALLTLLFRQVARPDELGMLLGYANVWWLLLPGGSSRWPVVSFVSGALAGLILCTSAGVLLAFMPFLVALWLLRVGEGDIRIRPSLAAAASAFGLTVAICVTPILVADPHSYQQLFRHLHHEIFGRGVVSMLSSAWDDSRQRLFVLLATLPVFCIGMITLWRAGRIRETLVLFVAPLVGFGLVVFTRQSDDYWWFLQPWFLLVAVTVAADFWWSRDSRLVSTVVVGWLAIWVTVASAWPVKDYLVRMTLPPEQRLTTSAQKLRELIPKGAGVLTANAWWELGIDRSVYHPDHSDIRDLARIEYFVTDGNGTGQPGRWFPPRNRRYEAMVRESFEVISDTLPRTALRIFGLRISNSAYGFGTIVLHRRSK